MLAGSAPLRLMPCVRVQCQDMFDSVDDMISDYMDGYTVNQMCENSRICR